MKNIKILVLHSHSGGYPTWDYLEKNWKLFGNIKITIHSKRSVSNELLQTEDPDIIILGDCAGTPYQFKQHEFQELDTYLKQHVGKHLLGTYATFFHWERVQRRDHIYDNRYLAQYFGIKPTLEFKTKRLSSKPTYCIEYQHPLLWKNMNQPFTSEGYTSTQIPRHIGWDINECFFDKNNVEVIAKSIDNKCIITHYKTPHFTSLYISTMPEYEPIVGNKYDIQFLYNSFIFLMEQSLFSFSFFCCCLLFQETNSFFVDKNFFLHNKY